MCEKRIVARDALALYGIIDEKAKSLVLPIFVLPIRAKCNVYITKSDVYIYIYVYMCNPITTKGRVKALLYDFKPRAENSEEN